MLAYLFWHRPYPTAEPRRYEEALASFQRRLSDNPPPGFRAVGSYRISPVPWLDGKSGYEDWCYVDGSWALDPLNGFAVAGAMKTPHDSAAAMAEVGHGGLYALAWGTPELLQRTTTTWLTRPRGIDWQAALAPVRAQFPNATCWRRQMALGQAAEFAVVVPAGQQAAAPSGWTALHVSGERVSPSNKT